MLPCGFEFLSEHRTEAAASRAAKSFAFRQGGCARVVRCQILDVIDRRNELPRRARKSCGMEDVFVEECPQCRCFFDMTRDERFYRVEPWLCQDCAAHADPVSLEISAEEARKIRQRQGLP